MAKAFPKSHFFGFDYHDKSIEAARESAKRNGVADRVTFEVAKQRSFLAGTFDFVAVFDCLARHGRPDWGGPRMYGNRWPRMARGWSSNLLQTTS